MYWKKIPEHSNYSASENGLIRRDSRLKNGTKPGIINPSINQGGYYAVALRGDDGKWRKLTVHQLVAKAFIGIPTDGMMVCHGDGNRKNNAITNLRYGTAKDNAVDKFKHGTGVRGNRVTNSKLNESDIPKIQLLLSHQELTQKEIAEMFGVTQRSIWQIGSGDSWRHITGGKPTTRAGKGARKLTDMHVVEILKLRDSGKSVPDIAIEYGVTVSNVYAILSGRSRKTACRLYMMLRPERDGFFEMRERH